MDRYVSINNAIKTRSLGNFILRYLSEILIMIFFISKKFGLWTELSNKIILYIEF